VAWVAVRASGPRAADPWFAAPASASADGDDDGDDGDGGDDARPATTCLGR